jgi:regulator of replication initiation timing
MEKTVQELKVLIKELILELGDLKERVTWLEKEVYPEPAREPLAKIDSLKVMGEGYDQLGRIYAEGYHVCPAAYGEPRRDDCLFCIAFMEKE